MDTSVTRGWAVVVAGGALLALCGCEALWPKCKVPEDCPADYLCSQNGRCVKVDTVNTSSSSSSGAASTSVGASSGPASSSGAGSSSLSGSSSVGGSSSGGVGSSSSSSGGSSSAAFCAGYPNVAGVLAGNFMVGTAFDAASCRDGQDVTYYWKQAAAGLRYKTQLRLDVGRSPLNGAVPAHPVAYNLTTGNGQGLVGFFGVGCNSFNNPQETCQGEVTALVQDLFVEVRPQSLDGGEPYAASGRVNVLTTPPCATLPTNTSPGTATATFLTLAGGPVCQSGVVYHWRHDCEQVNCFVTGRFEDDIHRQTPMLVEVTQPGGTVPCPVRDGGVFSCTVAAFDGGPNLVRVSAATDAGLGNIASEWVSIQVYGLRDDAGPGDGG